MKALRRVICIVLAAVSFLASTAYSTSFSTDQSDLYYIPTESGWGIQLVQRGSVIFATLFLFGAGGATTWFVATLNSTSNSTWTGDLYTGTGPYFGTVPFNPADVVGAKVGTMTWTPTAVTTGTLTYDVNGVAVVKNVIRQTLVLDDFNGHYSGILHTTTSGCVDATRNGTMDFVAVEDVTQSGPTINILISSVGGSCSFAGTYSQAGQFGAVSGAYTCGGDSGTFQGFELQVNITGFTGRFTAASSTRTGCQATGWFGGLRVTTF